MKNKKLTEWIEGLTTIQNLQDHVYPALPVLNGTTWDDSHLGELKGDNEVTEGYGHLDSSETKAAVETLLRNIPVDDLHEIQGMSLQELETRKGLALLLQTQASVGSLIADFYLKLRRLQSLRDHSAFELERRSREEMASKGMFEHLSPFTARFLYGPPPPEMLTPGKIGVLKSKKFLVARVKSGKQVGIYNLRFDIPDIYDVWLMEKIRKAGLTEDEAHSYVHSSPPSSAGPKLALLYYKLGFKPKKYVSGHYRIEWYAGSWNQGWHLSHSREFDTSELVPVD